MKVTYCDLCGQPIKDKKIRLLVTEYYEREYYNKDSEAINPYQRDTGWSKQKEVEICATCKEIIDNIFKKRMIGIIKLAQDLKHIYEVPEKDKDKT